MQPSFTTRATLVAFPLLSCLGLAQVGPKVVQPVSTQQDHKTPRRADPVKGFGEIVAVADDDSAREAAPSRDADAARAHQLLAAAGHAQDTVIYDQRDGVLWAYGATFKAAFGTQGFTYVPFLGAAAPRNYPVLFQLAGVVVGGSKLALDAGAPAVRTGDRVVFDRGAVREIYDISPRGIEQTFVVDSQLAGDIAVDLRVVSELREDAAQPGLQFGNALGAVEYGDAFVVRDGGKQAIDASFAGGVLTLHVPAGKRSAGATVIDPVISTRAIASTRSLDQADVAFDATVGHYLVAYQSNFSALDRDILVQMFDLNGNVVAGSSAAIDISFDDWRKPRVANLNAYDRFLVVAERFIPSNPVGQRATVWGRTQDAAAPHAQSAVFEVSGAQSGDKVDPDVGGDPNLEVPTYWTVVYTRELSSTDHDIHARQVTAEGNFPGSTIFIENSASTVFRQPRISNGNGDLPSYAQRALVTYTYDFSAADRDVYGAVLSWNGNILQASAGIETSGRDDRLPYPSSATHALPGPATFGVCFVSAARALYATVVDRNLASVVPVTNLSTLLAQSNIYTPAIESDGARFVLAYASGVPVFATTLGVLGASFVVQEAPVQVGSGHDGLEVNIAARASAGGSNTGYGIVFTDRIPALDTIVFATYEGHGQGGYFIRATGCAGLGIQASGRALLGRTTTITLTGTGQDLVGMLLGLPIPALPICPGCSLGVNLAGPLVNLPNVSVLNLPIPSNHAYVGSTVAVQGYALGSGTCLGLLRLGNTLDITIQ